MFINNKSGFTLLEITIVFALIAVLLAVVIPSFRGLQEESALTKAQADLAILQTAIEAYYSQVGKFPTDNYQNLLITTTKLFTQPLLDPLTDQKDEYAYYQGGTADKPWYVIAGAGLNRQVDFLLERVSAPNQEIDASGYDDLLMSNWKIKK